MYFISVGEHDEVFCDKVEDENTSQEDNQATDERTGSRCAVCLSLLWNADGMGVSDYTEAGP